VCLLSLRLPAGASQRRFFLASSAAPSGGRGLDAGVATAHSESGRWGKSRVHGPAIKGGGAARDRALPMTRLLTTAYSDERSNGVN
jgi:hypothetical protein